ncbi:MAG: hypothetical protein COA78_34855 [Blastopirellula sp.]|nr:MAG: hypothetical protein COA78_34855 [Blastopirellula sp.]
MKYLTHSLLLLIVAISAAACNFNKQSAGTLLGGATGALVGSQFGGGKGQIVATAAGTLLGAYVGQSIGASLDKADKLALRNMTSQALNSVDDGQTKKWKVQQGANKGLQSVTVQPVNSFYDRVEAAYCREFQQTIIVDGQEARAYGTACRQNDGAWKIKQERNI